MVRKRMIVLAAAAFIGGMSFTPSIAAADWYGNGHRADIRADRQDLQADRFDLRRAAETCGGIGAILVVICDSAVGQISVETCRTFTMIGCISGATAGTSGMIAGSCSGIDAVFDRPPEIENPVAPPRSAKPATVASAVASRTTRLVRR